MTTSIAGVKRKSQEGKSIEPNSAQKRTATMNKKLRSKANSWNFFDTSKELASTNDSTRRIILVAIELSTPENIGALIRLAGNIGCAKVIFTGDVKNFSMKRIKKTATTSGISKVNWEFCNEKEWPTRIPTGYTKIALETEKDATNIYGSALPDRVAFVVGNESFGITKWSLQCCDKAMYIPMPGILKSLNVTNAATIASFEWWRQGNL